MHSGWIYMGEWRQLRDAVCKGTLTPYREWFSLSMKTGVHEEEGNLQALEKRLAEQSGGSTVVSSSPAIGSWAPWAGIRAQLNEGTYLPSDCTWHEKSVSHFQLSFKRFFNIHHVSIYVFYPFQMDTYRDEEYTLWNLRSSINSVYSVDCVALVSRSCRI